MDEQKRFSYGKFSSLKVPGYDLRVSLYESASVNQNVPTLAASLYGSGDCAWQYRQDLILKALAAERPDIHQRLASGALVLNADTDKIYR